MKDKRKRVLDREQAIEEKANDDIIGWWEKLTNNSRLSYYLLIGITMLTLIIIFIILVLTKVI